MKKGSIILVVILGFIMISSAGWATVYVSDKLEVPVRAEPGATQRIINILQSGQVVEVLDKKDGWTHVRFMSGNRERDGWILSRYLMEREPWEKHVKALKAENSRLRETASPMAQELNDMRTRNDSLATALEEKMKEFEMLRESFESLQKDASNFLELQNNFQKAQSDLRKLESELAKAMKETEELRLSHSHTWFFTGAAVLLVGLLIGLIMGRRDKKRSDKLYL